MTLDNPAGMLRMDELIDMVCDMNFLDELLHALRRKEILEATNIFSNAKPI